MTRPVRLECRKFCFTVGANRGVKPITLNVLSRAPATHAGAESGRRGFKSILIGASIPLAEGPPAGIRGELGGAHESLKVSAVLVPRTG